MSGLTTITQQFLTECHEDYVGLWSLVKNIRRAGMAEGPTIVETTTAVLMPLLSERLVIAGQFVLDGKFHPGWPVDKNKFQEWAMRPQEVIAKIKAEWTTLGRDPNIGEIVWFTAVPELRHS
jgi:hypothetical protein